MKRVRLVVPGAIMLAAVSASGTQASADDADWGCQVLLCAASSAPSWHGIPYCVPPMTKLIAAMARRHFSWPICVSAGTGAPGFERYADCPQGYSIGYSSSGGHNDWNQEPNLCVKTVNSCLGGFSHGRDGSSDCAETVSQPRPLRPQPYYFDIRQASGKSERFWFDLNN